MKTRIYAAPAVKRLTNIRYTIEVQEIFKAALNFIPDASRAAYEAGNITLAQQKGQSARTWNWITLILGCLICIAVMAFVVVFLVKWT